MRDAFGVASCHRASTTPVLSLSLISKPLQAISQGDSAIQDNETVSTSIAIQRPIIVADHLDPSIYLDGVALRFSLRSYHSTQETSRDYTPGHSKTGLYTEIICR